MVVYSVSFKRMVRDLIVKHFLLECLIVQSDATGMSA